MVRRVVLLVLLTAGVAGTLAAQDRQPNDTGWYLGAAVLGQIYQAANASPPELAAFSDTLSGTTPGITAMAGRTVNRRMSIGFEATIGSWLSAPAKEHRSGVLRIYDVNETYGHRDVLLSLVARFHSSHTEQRGTFSLEPVIGVTLALSSERLTDRMQTTYSYAGTDYHLTRTTTLSIAEVETSSTGLGAVGGLDARWVITPRWSFVALFRVAYIPRDDYQGLPWGESGFENHPVPVGVNGFLLQAGGGVRWGRHR